MLGRKKAKKELPAYKVETVFGDRALRKSLNRHAALGYEAMDVTQKLAFGSNIGRSVTYKLKD